MGRFTTTGVRIFSALAVMVAAGAAVPASASEDLTTNGFTATGTVESVGAPVPTVPRATGSFVLGSITSSSGNVMQAAQNGDLTIYVKQDTKYYKKSTPSGPYATSNFESTVVVGANLYVNGRYYRSNDEWVLLANYVYSPPPAGVGTGVANPKPNGPNDYLLKRTFYVTARFSNTGAPVQATPRGPYTPIGFTLDGFTAYGCTPPCHVERIVKAHGGNLMVDNLNTTYWKGQPGGGYQKTAVRSEVVVTGQTATAVGRYMWDGFDWRFFASHVFSPAVAVGTGSGGPFKTQAHVTKIAPGTYDSVNDTWVGTQWAGPGGNFPAAPAQGDWTMTLDWQYNAIDEVWEFYGDYTLKQRNGSTSVSGTISGTASTNPIGKAEATLTVDQGTGGYNGYTGFGELLANLVNFNPSDGSEPPTEMSGDANFEIHT